MKKELKTVKAKESEELQKQGWTVISIVTRDDEQIHTLEKEVENVKKK